MERSRSGERLDWTRGSATPELLGPLFVKHGYLFLYLFRRGDGLSKGQGVPSADRMDSAAAAGGQLARNDLQLRLMEGDELNDVLAGLAFLRARPDVQAGRLAVVGVSFGGSLTLLVAERDSTLRAAVAFAIGGYSWERSPPLRTRLLEAADRTVVPIFFIHAANDYTVASGPSLLGIRDDATLEKPQQTSILRSGNCIPGRGHDLALIWGCGTWEADVFASWTSMSATSLIPNLTLTTLMRSLDLLAVTPRGWRQATSAATSSDQSRKAEWTSLRAPSSPSTPIRAQCDLLLRLPRTHGLRCPTGFATGADALHRPS